MKEKRFRIFSILVPLMIVVKAICFIIRHIYRYNHRVEPALITVTVYFGINVFIAIAILELLLFFVIRRKLKRSLSEKG